MTCCRWSRKAHRLQFPNNPVVDSARAHGVGVPRLLTKPVGADGLRLHVLLLGVLWLFERLDRKQICVINNPPEGNTDQKAGDPD